MKQLPGRPECCLSRLPTCSIPATLRHVMNRAPFQISDFFGKVYDLSPRETHEILRAIFSFWSLLIAFCFACRG